MWCAQELPWGRAERAWREALHQEWFLEPPEEGLRE